MACRSLIRLLGSRLGRALAFLLAVCVPSLAHAISPTATSSPATSIGKFTATLNGTVNPNGVDTQAQFLWGFHNSSLNHSTSLSEIGSGTSAAAFTADISGLQANTIYDFQIFSTSAGGTGFSAVSSFTTAPLTPPQSVSTPATGIGKFAATLNGTVNPRGVDTQAQFLWGFHNSSLNHSTPLSEIGAGTSTAAFTADISGLQANTIYDFQIFSTSADGTGFSAVSSFTTAPLTPPQSVSTPATGIGKFAATLNGTVNPRGVDTQAQFLWGFHNSSLNHSTPLSEIGAGTSAADLRRTSPVCRPIPSTISKSFRRVPTGPASAPSPRLPPRP